MIDHVIERTRRSQLVDEVVVATTTSPLDRRLINYGKLKDWSMFAGSEHDVLERYYQCAKKHAADQVVRITSDCPLISPELIDRVVKKQLDHPGNDYACNFHPKRTFPRGLDVECLSFETLERVHKIATEPNLREHVTLMIYCRPDLFELRGFTCNKDLSDWRWTVDTPEDLRLVRTVYNHFQDNQFTWRQAAQAFHDHPMWPTINQHVDQKAA